MCGLPGEIGGEVSEFQCVRVPCEEDRARYLQYLAGAFRIPTEFVETVEPELVRVIRSGDRVVGGYLLHDFGQFYGGSRVRMAGVGGVAIAPEARGLGAGAFLMEAALEEMEERGFPISTLYPATQPLYRRVGYELAGSRFKVEVSIRSLAHRNRGLTVRAFEEGDPDRAKALYREVAQYRPGNLDRSPAMWERVFRGRGTNPPDAYLVLDGSEPVGYAICLSEGPGMRQKLFLTDFVAKTPDASERLLSFFADHRSVVEAVYWYGSPTDPILYRLREQSYKVELMFHWMVRLLDVKSALEARGYARGLGVRLDLRVRDDRIPRNDGCFRLTLEDGQARCEEGGDGSVDIDARGLAALYTGHASPREMARAGYLRATDPDLDALGAAFVGQTPTMVDMF